MIQEDEKDLLKYKIEGAKEEKYRLDKEIIRLNSQIDEYLLEKLTNNENDLKLQKLYNTGLIDSDMNFIWR